MSIGRSRTLLWSVIALLLALFLLYLFWPRAVITQISYLHKSALKQTISDEGITRVKDVYTLSAPVTGYLRRIKAEVGDEVKVTRTVVAEIEPIDPTFLDQRSEAQAKADIETANSSMQLAQAEVDQAEAELEFAVSELSRMRRLEDSNSVSQRDLDNAQRIFKTSQAALTTAKSALQMRTYELERMKAQLLSPTSTQVQRGSCECLNITAPVNGKVLKVLNKSEGVVNAGTPLIEIGDPSKLEIVVELLSFDAVKVVPGQQVDIKNWGGEETLTGLVRMIEPIGFKKISALGIEEQRVNVVIDIVDDIEQWSRLGHGYQLDVDIILWQGEDVLSVPITALFREGDQWAIYAVVDNHVEKRIVKLGRQNTFHAQITTGLIEGEAFIAYPNNQIEDGVKVRSRDASE